VVDMKKVIVFVQLGEDLIQVGRAAVDDLRKVLKDSGADEAQLAKLDAAYLERIAREEAVQNGK
jgi:hypothetical protein